MNDVCGGIAKRRENSEIMRKHIFLRFFVFYAFFRNTGLFKFIALRKDAKTAKLCENIFFCFFSSFTHFFRNTGLFKFIALRKYAKTAKLCENIFFTFFIFSFFHFCAFYAFFRNREVKLAVPIPPSPFEGE